MAQSKLDAIDHIAIPVRDDDLDETIDFYLDNFGCEVIYRDDTWGFLRFGNIKLAFVVPDEHPPHLAFVSPRAEQFGTLKMHRDGTRSVYISDPSHNTIEIMAEYDEKAGSKRTSAAITQTKSAKKVAGVPASPPGKGQKNSKTQRSAGTMTKSPAANKTKGKTKAKP